MIRPHQRCRPRSISSSAARTRPRCARRPPARRRPPRSLVFYQPALTCTACHVNEKADATAPTLGPDLAAIGKDAPDGDLVESILEPSKVDQEGLRDGHDRHRRRPDDHRPAGRGAARRGRPPRPGPGRQAGHDRPGAGSRSGSDGGPSLMPAGLVNALASRQQFLDLVRYLMEIAEYGPARARALRPDPALVVAAAARVRAPARPRRADRRPGPGEPPPRRGDLHPRLRQLPRHEGPARLAAQRSSVRLGRRSRTAATPTASIARSPTASARWRPRPGWSPGRSTTSSTTSARRSSSRTTRPSTPAVNRAYLDRLPKGNTRGPSPSEIEPWVAMDYGPCLLATIEAGDDLSNFAYKGIAVRLDPGQGGVSRGRAWVVYDHDTLRLAAAWTGQGFIDWNGINFNGRHQVHPRVVGRVHVANADGPGWANPNDPDAEDRRIVGRDGRRYGPMPARLGALPRALPPRRPGGPRLHRRHGRCARDAGPRDRPRPARCPDLRPDAGSRPLDRRIVDAGGPPRRSAVGPRRRSCRGQPARVATGRSCCSLPPSGIVAGRSRC